MAAALGVSVLTEVRDNREQASSAISGLGSTHGSDLKTYMMPAPAGSHPWRTKPADSTLDLNGAAAYSTSSTAGAELLLRYGFEQGYVRRWVSDQGSITDVRLLHFPAAKNAFEYFESYKKANEASAGWSGEAKVAGDGNALSFLKLRTDNPRYQASMSFGQSGDLVVVVNALQLSPATAAVSNAVLTTEYACL